MCATPTVTFRRVRRFLVVFATFDYLPENSDFLVVDGIRRPIGLVGLRPLLFASIGEACRIIFFAAADGRVSREPRDRLAGTGKIPCYRLMSRSRCGSMKLHLPGKLPVFGTGLVTQTKQPPFDAVLSELPVWAELVPALFRSLWCGRLKPSWYVRLRVLGKERAATVACPIRTP